MSKAGKKRYCPATQQEISSQECGEHRNSKYRCPKDCSFNLFAPANYSQLLEAETRVDKVAYEALITEPAYAQDTIRRLKKAGFDDHAVNSAVLRELHFQRDASGQTFGQRWEKSGFGELKNDLRCLFRAKMGMYVALVEVLRVIDADSLECRDLFDPSRPTFLLLDRSAARRACRHDVILSHCYDLPHFTRIFGTAIPLPFMGTMEPEEVVREIVSHLGGPIESPGLQDWLVNHPLQFVEALQATIAARHDASMAASDLRIGKALYQLSASYSECRAALDAVPDVAPEELSAVEKSEGFADARVWFAGEEDAKHHVSLAREALGTVLLGQTFWRLQAISQERMDRFRQLFEAALGGRVKLDTVRMDDLHKSRRPDAGHYHPLVPPALLLDLPKFSISSSRIPRTQNIVPGVSMEELMQRSADMAFLDDSIPALDGATPTAAAKDPNLLPKLRRLLKQRINGADRNALEKGDRYDASWLAKELGQDDLCTPPPPPRAIFSTEPPSGSLKHSSDRLKAPNARIHAPPLPPHLSADEVLNRIDRAMEAFPNFKDAEEEAIEAGCTWLADVMEIPLEPLSPPDLAALSSALVEAWFVMVPRGHYAREVPIEKVFVRFNDYLEKAYASSTDAELKHALTSRFQLPLGQIVGAGYLKYRGELKPKPKKMDNGLVPVVLILALIDELHVSLGGATQ